jgi:hypothetical protein
LINNKLNLKKILETVLFLIKQGIPLRGHDESVSSFNKGNFIEMIEFRKKDNHDFKVWLETNKSNYTSPDIQNEIILINQQT